MRDNGTSFCTLPNFPEKRIAHSQAGLVSCGGSWEATGDTCLTFSNGMWNLTHTLIYERNSHKSWASPIGVIIIGGRADDNSKDVTELLTSDGMTKEHFRLQYEARWAMFLKL